MTSIGKKFVLSHLMKNVSSIEVGGFSQSAQEEYFGVPWELQIYREADTASVNLSCEQSKSIGEWAIETKFEFILKSANGRKLSKNGDFVFESSNLFNYADSKNFIDWKAMTKDYVVDDSVIFEAHVEIVKMTGFKRVDVRKFDSSMEKYSDVIIVVNGRKFYVARHFLAAQSTYFDALLLGNFEESKKAEVTINGVDSEHFQVLLEALYGETVIDEFCVEGLFLLTDMLDTPTVTRQCERFLINESLKTLKKKMELAIRYNLENLKKKCLVEMKTVSDVREIFPLDEIQSDASVLKAMVEILLESA